MSQNIKEKLLAIIDDTEPELATCQEEECVICIHAKATMQTAPCGHQVVCRKCFVKTVQIAVSQRLLPLRCVICRAKILRLKQPPGMLPTSASGYSVNSRASSVPQSDSLYSVSSGGSSLSAASTSSAEGGKLTPDGPVHCANSQRSCCASGRCLGGAYPRQPTTGAIRRSQRQAMKMTLQDYCRPEKSVNRLPPIRELPGASPLHTAAPPASTRIRCAQKIITQLELPIFGRTSKGYKYEKLGQEDEEAIIKPTSTSPVSPSSTKSKWWNDKKWADKIKSEEKIDNKKNEIMEKHMEMQEKQGKLGKESSNKVKEKETSFCKEKSKG